MPVENLDQYENQRVLLVRNVTEDDGSIVAEESEGTVLAVNAEAGGILFKPKGRVQAQLLMTDDLESIEFAPIKEKSITVRWLKDVKFGMTRQHLADRHGWPVAEVDRLSEAEALEEHGQIDHEGLSHRHGEKPEKENEDSTDEE